MRPLAKVRLRPLMLKSRLQLSKTCRFHGDRLVRERLEHHVESFELRRIVAVVDPGANLVNVGRAPVVAGKVEVCDGAGGLLRPNAETDAVIQDVVAAELHGGAVRRQKRNRREGGTKEFVSRGGYVPGHVEALSSAGSENAVPNVGERIGLHADPRESVIREGAIRDEGLAEGLDTESHSIARKAAFGYDCGLGLAAPAGRWVIPEIAICREGLQSALGSKDLHAISVRIETAVLDEGSDSACASNRDVVPAELAVPEEYRIPIRVDAVVARIPNRHTFQSHVSGSDIRAKEHDRRVLARKGAWPKEYLI